MNTPQPAMTSRISPAEQEAGADRALRRARAPVPVLMYHHVSPNNDMITTTPERFEAQMAWLARAGYTTLDTEGFARFLAGGEVPERSVLLTFDDGYLDNWVYAHPILRRHGLRAVLFLITGCLHDGPPRPHAEQGAALPDTPSHRDCEAAIDIGRADDVMLRWSEVQAMREAGTFEFHSHTHTHTRWDKLHGDDPARKTAALREDLIASRDALARELGQASDQLCWPQGYFDADYLAVAGELGFRYLYTTDPKGRNLPGSAPSHIHRIAAKDEDDRWLRRRLWLARSRRLGPIYDYFRYGRRRR